MNFTYFLSLSHCVHTRVCVKFAFAYNIYTHTAYTFSFCRNIDTYIWSFFDALSYTHAYTHSFSLIYICRNLCLGFVLLYDYTCFS